MTVVNPGVVKLLRERFPHVQEVSLQLLVKNEAFRDLCEEYEACAATTERLAKTGGDASIRKEYAALQLRLEGELLSYLSQKD